MKTIKTITKEKWDKKASGKERVASFEDIDSVEIPYVYGKKWTPLYVKTVDEVLLVSTKKLEKSTRKFIGKNKVLLTEKLGAYNVVSGKNFSSDLIEFTYDIAYVIMADLNIKKDVNFFVGFIDAILKVVDEECEEDIKKKEEEYRKKYTSQKELDALANKYCELSFK